MLTTFAHSSPIIAPMQFRQCPAGSKRHNTAESVPHSEPTLNTKKSSGSVGHRILSTVRNALRTDMFLAEAAVIRSVKVSHHLVLGEGLEVVDIETLGLESRASVRGNQLVVQLRSDRKF